MVRICICGCRRTGTNLLRGILDSHPKINMHNYDNPELQYVIGLLELNTEFERFMSFRNLPKHITPDMGEMQFAHKATNLTKALELIYRPNTGIKCHNFAISNYFILYHQLLPFKFIHITRNIADVTASGLRCMKKHYNFEEEVRMNLSHQILGNTEFIERSRKDLYITYENLVTLPEVTARQICLFLDIPYKESMTNLNNNRTNFHGSTRIPPRFKRYTNSSYGIYGVNTGKIYTNSIGRGEKYLTKKQLNYIEEELDKCKNLHSS